MEKDLKHKMSKISYIEFHDSRVEKICADDHNKICIEFRHLVVYEKIRDDFYEVWKYSGEIVLSNGEQIEIPFSISGNKYISDVSIIDSKGQLIKLDVDNFEQRLELQNFEIVFSDGSRLIVRNCNFQLKKFDAIGQLDTWIGPLF